MICRSTAFNWWISARSFAAEMAESAFVELSREGISLSKSSSETRRPAARRLRMTCDAPTLLATRVTHVRREQR